MNEEKKMKEKKEEKEYLLEVLQNNIQTEPTFIATSKLCQAVAYGLDVEISTKRLSELMSELGLADMKCRDSSGQVRGYKITQADLTKPQTNTTKQANKVSEKSKFNDFVTEVKAQYQHLRSDTLSSLSFPEYLLAYFEWLKK